MRKQTDERKQGRAERSARRQQRQRQIVGYEIRVAGHLDEAALDETGEICAANLPGGEARIAGEIPDQAALLRVLLDLNDRGMMILSVKAKKGRGGPRI